MGSAMHAVSQLSGGVGSLMWMIYVQINKKTAMMMINVIKFATKTGLQIRVRTRKLFFLFLNQNICCGTR